MKVYKFFKQNCSPCMTLARVLTHLEGHELIPVDIDLPENKELVTKYNIERVPVLAFTFTTEHQLQGVKSVFNIEKWISEYGNQAG